MATIADKEQDQDDYDESFASKGCFSRLFCFPSIGNSNNIESKSLLQGESREAGWTRRIKQFSGLLAVPKWKTFICRLRNNHNHHNDKKKGKPQFQYDPLSYALNFDGGAGEEDDEGHLDFSARFAEPGRHRTELGHDPARFQFTH